MEAIIALLSRELDQPAQYVENVVRLLDEGNTVPFIARYRKEMTGSLDDQIIRRLSERLASLRNLEEKREQVKNAIAEQGSLTDELEKDACVGGNRARVGAACRNALGPASSRTAGRICRRFP